MKKITLKDIKDTYQESDVCMAEMLASVSAGGLTIEEAFYIFVESLQWSDRDQFYWRREGDIDEILPKGLKEESVQSDIIQMYNQYVEEHNNEPKFAYCLIQWLDDDSTECHYIKLSSDYFDTSEDPDDDKVIFFCNGIHDLQDMANSVIHDFRVIKCIEFCETI